MSFRTRLVLAAAYLVAAVVLALEIPLALNIERRADADFQAAVLGDAALLAARVSDEVAAAARKRLERDTSALAEAVTAACRRTGPASGSSSRTSGGRVLVDSAGEATPGVEVRDVGAAGVRSRPHRGARRLPASLQRHGRRRAPARDRAGRRRRTRSSGRCAYRPPESQSSTACTAAGSASGDRSRRRRGRLRPRVDPGNDCVAASQHGCATRRGSRGAVTSTRAPRRRARPSSRP